MKRSAVTQFPWSLRQGEIDVLNRMHVPKKARQDLATRRRLFGVLQPQSLRSAMSELSASAPDGLAEYVSAICAYTPPGSPEVEAFADAPGKNSRLITVSQGFMWLLMATVVLFEELEEPVRETAAKFVRAEGKQILEPLVALKKLDGLAGEVHSQLSLGDRAEHLISILLHARNSPDQLKAAFDSIIAGPPPSSMTHGLIGAALRFVLAHETSHHLLNHTLRTSVASAPPGEAFLREQLAELEMEQLAPTTSRSHVEEFSADSLGFLLTCGDLPEDPDLAYLQSVMSVAGAFIALPALSLIDEAGLEVASRTHPALLDRCRRLGELVLRYCPPNPASPIYLATIGREVAGDPEAAALQLWLVIAVISRRMGELAQ